MFPEFGLAAKAAQLDHRQRKFEAVVLGALHDGLVQVKGRHVLRRILGDQPAVVTDGDEDAYIHWVALRIPCVQKVGVHSRPLSWKKHNPGHVFFIDLNQQVGWFGWFKLDHLVRIRALGLCIRCCIGAHFGA